jgi:hypothetical protein
MKNFLLFTAIFIVWAGSAIAADSRARAPYSETYASALAFADDPRQNDNGIQMYPNPVTEGRITIKSEEAFTLIQILNITGEIVYNQEFPAGSNSEVIELNNIQKGMYLVRVGFAGKPNFTAKIIVK